MRDRYERRRAAWASVAVLTALLVAGCSGTPSAPPSPSEGTTTTAPSSPPSADTPTPGSAAPSSTAPTAEPSATAAPAQALAGRDFTVSGTYSRLPEKMRFEVVELRRRGDLLDLTAQVTNLEKDRSQDSRWQMSDKFQGPYRKDLAGKSGYVFSGAVLTDVAGKKRYLVAADSSGACVCTEQMSSIFLGAGQSVELTATYAAPPAATTKFDVHIDSLGTFRDLPII